MACYVLVQRRLAGATIGGNEPFDAVPFFFWSAHTRSKLWVMLRPGIRCKSMVQSKLWTVALRC